MPSNDTADQEVTARANELYWQSGKSVNQIAEEMDLSKSRLYGLVQPLAVGSPCPECGADLLFPNRTAMEKGLVSCPECGYEGAAQDAPAESGNTEPEQDTTMAPARTRSGSKRVLWGSALLGLAAGLYVVIRQRRS